MKKIILILEGLVTLALWGVVFATLWILAAGEYAARH